ncbi:MAG: LOG family protein [Patescibacteria group bacterium]
MPPKSSQTLFAQKKRRVIGEMIRKAELKNKNAWVSIHRSSKEDMITYESKGFVVSINGSGTLAMDHAQCKEAGLLSAYVVGHGGIVINGGRSSGIIAASSHAAGPHKIGIVFPEIEKEADDAGSKALVNSPQPRNELLSTCAPIIVIFRGGLGTLMTLLRSIVHIKNRPYHPDQLPQMVFISNYWIGLLTTLMNMGTLPREFIVALHFFDSAQDIINKIPSQEG